ASAAHRRAPAPVLDGAGRDRAPAGAVLRPGALRPPLQAGDDAHRAGVDRAGGGGRSLSSTAPPLHRSGAVGPAVAGRRSRARLIPGGGQESPTNRSRAPLIRSM